MNGRLLSRYVKGGLTWALETSEFSSSRRFVLGGKNSIKFMQLLVPNQKSLNIPNCRHSK